MKLLRWILIMLVCLVMVGCGEDIKTLPPDYKLMCSSSGDKYSLTIPSNRVKSGSFKSPCVWDTKREAIRFAWLWEKDRNEPFVNEALNYDWEVCETEPQ